MESDEISIKDKDLSVIDNLVNEIIGENNQQSTNYSNLSEKLTQGEVVDNSEINNLSSDSEKEKLRQINQNNKERNKLQTDIANLENKPNKTSEEEQELIDKKKRLKELSDNNNQNTPQQ